MSGRKVLLFLLSVYALLAALCFLFPADGISAGNVTLVFAGPKELAESLGCAQKSKTISPEDLLQQRKESARRAEKERFEEYFNNNPARLYFPSDDPTLFDPFFAALDEAGTKQLRILHYGDSQIEEDRITSTLRAGLQERFGGGGPGLLPFGRPYYTMGFSQSCTADLSRAAVFGESARKSNSRYGIMGQCARMDTSVFTTVSAVKDNKSASRTFNRLTLLAGNISAPVNVKCGKLTQKLSASDERSGVARLVFDLPDSSDRVRFSVWGAADIYGVQLDDTLGVCVDNIPMRGCSGTVFTRMNSSQIREYAEQDNVRLIILQYGGNVVPYRKTGNAISEYKTSIEKQIKHLHTLAPKASILFIGPSDMSTNIKGRMQTYPHLPMLADSLKSAAVNSGAAYWDMFAAMGGEGSMAEWVKARPQLAGNDYVHFTPRGAVAIGEMLLETIMLYYDWYRTRKYGLAE
ncbi:MAG: hypothetical protein IJU68_05335 [Bacteroidales bacterium]|nr:hypothetical protein [Bacteroidales bacterium]